MSLIVEIKVVPSSGKNGWILDKSGKLKCYLKNPPERNLANNELIKLLAKSVGVPQTSIEIVSGHTVRNKRVCIAQNLTIEQLYKILGVAQQQKLF